MKELDDIYGTSMDDLEDAEENIPDYLRDPFIKKRDFKMKHQEFRTIKVGPIDLLRNGQMI